jgi:hypothetical protein
MMGAAVEQDEKDFSKSFTHVIVGDVIRAHQRLTETDRPGHRRDLVRAVFAAIEGLHWQLKEDVLGHPSLKMSVHERAAMAEETYLVDDKGKVRVVPRFLPLPHAIRLVVHMVQRYRPTYRIDFSHVGWSNLKAAIEVRNRLVHPKKIEDLTVEDGEVEATLSGFAWILALVIEVLRINNEDLAELTKEVKGYVADAKDVTGPKEQ